MEFSKEELWGIMNKAGQIATLALDGSAEKREYEALFDAANHIHALKVRMEKDGL